MSKAGQVDIRRLLIIGAMARVSWASRRPPHAGLMAGPDAGSQTANAGSDRAGEQDGSQDLGDADKTGRFS